MRHRIDQADSHYDWSIAVFCRNEERTISSCLSRLELAANERNAVIYVLVNGSTDRTLDLARKYKSKTNLPVKVYAVDFPDKSNAWNQLIHSIRPDANYYMFVDGYLEIKSDALLLLEKALIGHPSANAATGGPTSGISAAHQMNILRTKGGLQGGLHALSRDFVNRIRNGDFRIPIGLYRGDGLLNSMAMHNLNPKNPWQRSNVVYVPESTWHPTAHSLWSISELGRVLNRRVQQARGTVENAAIKKIIYEVGKYQTLPKFADDLILDYLSTQKPISGKLLDDLFLHIATKRLRHPRRPADAETIPKLADA